MLTQLQKDLRSLADPKRARVLSGFFKTGKSQYGAGDIFIGVIVPDSRKVARQYSQLPLVEIEQLLQSPVHEERLVALLILVHQFQKGDKTQKKELYDFYLAHTKYVNNWDLVDLSAGKIVGAWLVDKNWDILRSLAKSSDLWEKRIAMIATGPFLLQKNAEPTFTIADILLHDSHDLIQKAVGWMLREVGKRVSREAEEKFLSIRYQTMPRTTLRYAIEHFPEPVRQAYLHGTI